MQIHQTAIPGCFELRPDIKKDDRGCFIKTFRSDFFSEQGLVTQFAEEYHTISRQGVLRGMHFQLPPMEHTKLVSCLFGTVLDTVVDLRLGSPTYGTYALFELSAEKSNIIYIPVGLAHGFFVLSPSAVLTYKVTSLYDPTCDSGIHWASVGISWPTKSPIISKRDANLISFKEFTSPFTFKGSLQNER